MSDRPRPRDADATRQRLLEAAERVFVEDGYAGARVDRVAEVSGVNKRMIYAYFGSKAQLYEAVLRAALGRLVVASGPVLATDGPTLEVARGFVRWYFRFLADDPHAVRLMGWEDAGQVAGRAMLDVAAGALDALRETLRRGVAEGVFRADLDAPKFLLTVHSLCHGYLARRDLLETVWGRPLDAAEDDRMLEHILGVVFEGICRHAPSGVPS